MRCAFCEIAANGTDEISSKILGNAEDRRMAVFDGFFVMESVAPMTTDHLLLCTIDHKTAFAELDPADVLSAVTRIEKEWPQEQSCYFEHGALHPSRTACGITHAHAHRVSIPYAEMRNLVLSEADSLGYETCELNYAQFLREAKQLPEYIMFTSNWDDVLLIKGTPETSLQSQFGRRISGLLTGAQPWNWRLLPELSPTY